MQIYQWIIVWVVVMSIIIAGAIDHQTLKDCMAKGNSKEICYSAIGG